MTSLTPARVDGWRERPISIARQIAEMPLAGADIPNWYPYGCLDQLLSDSVAQTPRADIEASLDDVVPAELRLSMCKSVTLSVLSFVQTSRPLCLV